MSEIEDVLAEQRRYYSARAGEYEDWWFRRGRYDHGEDANEQWFAEAEEVRAALDSFAPAGRVLELACGTGLWTERLAGYATQLTAIDASAEVLALAESKVRAENVDYVQADLFAWEPLERYDVCFFAFWLSHVPRELQASFWAKVRRSLAPGGRVYLIDSARSPHASARDHTLQAPEQEMMLRRLADGREYQIVKHWFDTEKLARALSELGWESELRETEEFFVYGQAHPRDGAELP